MTYNLNEKTLNNKEKVVTRCFTPSQPLRLDQGDNKEEELF